MNKKNKIQNQTQTVNFVVTIKTKSFFYFNRRDTLRTREKERDGE